MTNKVVLIKNRYVDSVTLMSLSERLCGAEGVVQSDVQMCTPANRELLTDAGFEVPAEGTPNDLVIAVRAESEGLAERGVTQAEALLNRGGGHTERTYHSIREIDLADDPFDLAQISLPGKYAAKEGMEALGSGLDVFMFSDNVSLEEERELKEYAVSHGRLMMGPDCGVGIVKGVALGAGSIAAKGEVGIVAASGSGAQEIACLLERFGIGVSALIGTGGRDLYPEIGGMMMLEGMRRLERDPETKAIILVSKLADPGVMEKVLTVADRNEKPTVAVFLGGDETLFAGHRVQGTFDSLEKAALLAVEAVKGAPVTDFGFSQADIEGTVACSLKRWNKKQRYLRGLYCGGTFTEEGMLYFSEHNPETKLYSNLDTRYTTMLESHLISKGNAILDLGSEEFTKDAPHPVFDPAIRLSRFRQELEDEETAVLLLDFITGPGVHPDPITAFIEPCRDAVKRGITVVANICGSVYDPQDIVQKRTALEAAGVVVSQSNYQSLRMASALMRALEQRR